MLNIVRWHGYSLLPGCYTATILCRLYFMWSGATCLLSSSTLLFQQSTYEYGKQLLQAALVLRRSLHHDLKPNHERAMRLLDVWKKFSQGVNERASRLNGIAIFHKNADSVSV